MIRLTFFLVAFFGFGSSIIAQEALQLTDLKPALSAAAEQKKMVLLTLESKDCAQCNQAAATALNDKALQPRISQAFISVLVSADSKLWKDYAKSFNAPWGGALLFFDEAGTLVYRYNTTGSNPKIYNDQLTLAMGRRASGVRIRSLENSYQQGERTVTVMESLLVARNRVGLETDSLLDEYARALSPDSLKSRRVILFIARLSPILGSPSDSALRKNEDFFSQCWFSIPADQRVAINNNIIRKSNQAAIARKDIDAAYLTASFAKSTYFDSYNAQRIYDQTMIEYFREAADTAKYIPMAVYYYDNYFMSVPVDSIQVIDTLKLREDAAKPNLPSTTPVALTTVRYSKQLANAAWSFYAMTNDSAALSRALNWARRATEFSPLPTAIDVYARLLYLTGEKKSGIEFEENAIDELKKKGLAITDQEEILRRMKTGARLKDRE